MAALNASPPLAVDYISERSGYGDVDVGIRAPVSALHAVAAAVRDIEERALLRKASHNSAWTEYLNAVDSAKDFATSVISRSPEKTSSSGIRESSDVGEDKKFEDDVSMRDYKDSDDIIPATSKDSAKLALAASVIAARTLRVIDPESSIMLTNVARVATSSSLVQKATPTHAQHVSSQNLLSPVSPLTTPTKVAALAAERARVLSDTEAIAPLRSGNSTPPGNNSSRTKYRDGTGDESVASSGSRRSMSSSSSSVKQKTVTAPLSPPVKMNQENETLFPATYNSLNIDMTSFEDLWQPSAASLTELANDRVRLERELALRSQEMFAESQAVEEENLALKREAEAISSAREAAASLRREMAEAKASGSAALRLQAAARGFITRKRTQLPSLLAVARAELEKERQMRAEEEAKQIREAERRAAAEAERIERARIMSLEAEATETERRKREALELSEAKERERRRIELLEAARLAAELEFQQRLAQEAREARERQLQVEFEESQRRRQALELSRMSFEDKNSLIANKAWRLRLKEELERSLMSIELFYGTRLQPLWSAEADIKRAERKLREIESRAKEKEEKRRMELEKRLRYLDTHFGAVKTFDQKPLLLKRMHESSSSVRSGSVSVHQRLLNRTSNRPSIAAQLQAMWRGKKIRDDPNGVLRTFKLLKKHSSATRIQSLWRGFRLRKAISEALEGARFADGDDFDYASVDVDSFLGPLPQHLLGPEGGGKSSAGVRPSKFGMGSSNQPLNMKIMAMNQPPNGIPVFAPPPTMTGLPVFPTGPMLMPMMKGIEPLFPSSRGMAHPFMGPPSFPLMGDSYRPGLVAAAHEEQKRLGMHEPTTRSHINPSPITQSQNMNEVSSNLGNNPTGDQWASRKIGGASASPISTPSRIEHASPSASRGTLTWELESIGSESRSGTRGSVNFSAKGMIGNNNKVHPGPTQSEIEAVEGAWGLHDPSVAALILKRKSRMSNASSMANAGKAQSAALERAVRVASTDGFVDRGTFLPSNANVSGSKGNNGTSSFVSRVRGAVGVGGGQGQSQGQSLSQGSIRGARSKYSFGSVQDNLPDDLK